MLLGAILAPVALAADDLQSGDVQTAEATSVLGDFRVETNSSVGLWTVDGGTFLELVAAHLSVTLYEQPIVGGPIVNASPTRATQESHAYDDARLVLQGGTDGYVGYVGVGDHARISNGSRLQVAASGPETITTTSQALANPNAPDDTSEFTAKVGDPHLRLSGDGVLRERFSGVIKLDGPDVEVDHAAGHDSFTTGHLPGTPVTGTHRWAVVRVDGGNLTVASRDEGVAIVPDVSMAWSGTMEIPGAHGSVSGTTGARLLNGEDIVVPGPAEARIAPVQADGVTVAREIVRSDANLGAAGAPLALPPIRFSNLLLAGGLLVILGALGGVRLYRRLRPPVSMDECVDMANAALAGGRHAVALEWLERALALGPETARLRMEQGDCLAALGDVPAALQAYERAAELTEDGEPLYMAALLAEAVEEGPEAVEQLLARALERTPLFALELEEDFPRLRARRSFRAMLSQARGRIG